VHSFCFFSFTTSALCSLGYIFYEEKVLTSVVVCTTTTTTESTAVDNPQDDKPESTETFIVHAEPAVIKDADRDDEMLEPSSDSPRVTILDITMYNGEPVLFFRLAMLYDKVDHFYIIESNYTFDGKEKDILHKDLNAALFEPYKDKIHWFVPPEGQDLVKLSQEDRKRNLRDASLKRIEEDLENGIISKPFVSIISDVDEIITPSDLDAFQPGKKYHTLATNVPIRFRMDSFEYNLNWKRKKKRITAYTLPDKKLTTQVLDSPGRKSINALQAANQIDSGFHLSNFFGIDELARKMTYSTLLKADENLQKCLSAEEPCLWKGTQNNDMVHWDYKQTPGAIQKFHEQICKIQNVDPATGGISKVDGSDSPEQMANTINDIGKIKQDSWKSSGNLPPRVMVVDSIMYNGEPIVPVRLATLNDVVDRFYIIEGTHSFSGIKKEGLFKDLNAHIFEPFKDKIHWVVYDMTDINRGDNWGRERAGRQASVPAIKEDFEDGIISNPFVVINTDADEIPDPIDIENFQPGRKYHDLVTNTLVVFQMKDFYYNLHWSSTAIWNKAHTLPGDKVLMGLNIDAPRTDRIMRWGAASIQGGYHLSYFLDFDGIRHKLNTFPHQELNKEAFKTDEHLQKCVSTGHDLFNRRNSNRVKWDYKQAPVALQKFHEETCKRQNVDPTTAEILVENDIGNVTQDSWKSSGNLPPRVMVVDSIMYNGEPIVPVRLATLNDVVDRFYIIEGTHSFSGIKKEGLFKDLNAHIFEPFKDKIHWVVYDMTDINRGDNWGRERAGRQASVPAIKEDFEDGIISNPFVVINTDADEIPDPIDIENFQPGRKYHDLVTNTLVVFQMKDFYYNLHWSSTAIWNKAHTLPGDKVLMGLNIDAPRTDRIMRWGAASIQGGYHLSYFLDFDGIRHKLNTFPHQELNKEAFKTDEHLQKCVSTGHDLFNRRNSNRVKWDYKQAPVALQKFHEETCKRQNVDPTTAEILVEN